MGTPRNFNNTASGASLNATLTAGATSAALNNYSNFPPAPFTATIARNQPDEEIVLVTAVSGSTVTLTRGYDGTAGQAHNPGASFELTAVAKDFNEAQQHINATGAVHGLAGNIVGDSDAQTLSNKTVLLLKGLASASGAAYEADNSGGTTGKLFRGLQAGVEKFFVDYTGALTAQAVTGTTGSFSGALSAAAATFTGLTTNGNASVTGTLTANTVTASSSLQTGASLIQGQLASNPGNASAGFVKQFAKTDGGTYLLDSAGVSRRLAVAWGSATSFPASPLVGDTCVRSDIGGGSLWRYAVAGWRLAENLTVATPTALAAIPAAVLYDGLTCFVTSHACNYRVWNLSGTLTWKMEKPYCQARLSGDVGLALGDNTIASWTASKDPDGILFSASGPKIQVPGLYRLHCHASATATGTGIGFGIRLFRNGTVVTTNTIGSDTRATQYTNGDDHRDVIVEVDLVAGDQIYTGAFNSGATNAITVKQVIFGAEYTYLTVEYVGPTVA